MALGEVSNSVDFASLEQQVLAKWQRTERVARTPLVDPVGTLELELAGSAVALAVSRLRA